MTWQELALAFAGAIGSFVAIIHGILVERRMVKPLNSLLAEKNALTPPLRRVLSPLLHFSTFAWFVGGIALIIAACLDGYGVKLAIGIFGRKSIPIRCGRQSLGHARASSRLDPDVRCTGSHLGWFVPVKPGAASRSRLCHRQCYWVTQGSVWQKYLPVRRMA